MAHILLVGQVRDSSNQELLGNRSTLEPFTSSFCWRSEDSTLNDVLLPTAGTRRVDFLLHYNTQQQYYNPSDV